MSAEMKCPACKAVLSEPLPERCPVCKLQGLNLMFLTREDYENWKTTIFNKHVMKMNCQIFAGYDGVLLLMGKTLYGLGDNTQGQYSSNHIGEKIEKPEKIAEDVISAAAGSNYSLYLDKEGKVHFLGNSGIPFRERFNQGSLIFKKVYADIDIFWGEDLNSRLYIWGHNALTGESGQVGYIDEMYPELHMTDKLLTTLPPVSIVRDIEFFYLSENATSADGRRENNVPLIDDIEKNIKLSDEYRKFVKMYGEINLKIEFDLNEKTESSTERMYFGSRPEGIPGPDDGWYHSFSKEDMVYTPKIYLTNRAFFQPQLCEKEFCIDGVKVDNFLDINLYKELYIQNTKCSPFIGIYEYVCENFHPDIWKKLLITYYDGSYYLIGIDKNNVLKIYDFSVFYRSEFRRYDTYWGGGLSDCSGYKSKRGNFLTIKEKIVDCSISYGQNGQSLWLIDQSGKLWRCKLNDEIFQVSGTIKLADFFDFIYEF